MACYHGWLLFAMLVVGLVGASESICLIYRLSPSKPGQSCCFWLNGGLSRHCFSHRCLRAKQHPKRPDRRWGHTMAIGNSVQNWLMKLTVNFLSLVFLRMRPRTVCFIFLWHAKLAPTSAVWARLLLLLLMTTGGQYCHVERGAFATVFSRLRRHWCLVKVL